MKKMKKMKEEGMMKHMNMLQKKLLYHDMHDEEINLDLNKCYMWVDCHEIKIIEIYIVIKVYLMCKFIIKSNYTLKCLFHYPKNIN